MAPALVYNDIFGPLKVWKGEDEGYGFSYLAPPQERPLASISNAARQSVTMGVTSLYTEGDLLAGLAGMYIGAHEQQSIVDYGLVFDAYNGVIDAKRRYRADVGAGARLGFLGAGLVTVETFIRLGDAGAWGRGSEHQLFADGRLQLLIELGQKFYARPAAGYVIGTDGASGFAASLEVGFLVGAFGGGALDVRNISRGL